MFDQEMLNFKVMPENVMLGYFEVSPTNSYMDFWPKKTTFEILGRKIIFLLNKFKIITMSRQKFPHTVHAAFIMSACV